MVGRADTVPIDSNETPQGRARNRRVDVVILNSLKIERLIRREGRRFGYPFATPTMTIFRRFPPSMQKNPKNPEKAPRIIEKSSAR